jgi:hypothetical protein
MLGDTLRGMLLVLLFLTLSGAIAEGCIRSRERYEARKREKGWGPWSKRDPHG